MSDEEIIEYVSNNNEFEPNIIKYIIDRGEGSIEGKEDNQELCELFENERQAYDGIRFGMEFYPQFTEYIINTIYIKSFIIY